MGLLVCGDNWHTPIDSPDSRLYTRNDLEVYRQISIDSDSMYQANDRITNKPKSIKGDKGNNLIKEIWNTRIVDRSKQGENILEYNEHPVEYKYLNNLNELISRLNYIYAQEQAGNNNFYNDKLGIVDFFRKELEMVIDSWKGVEYLIRFV